MPVTTYTEYEEASRALSLALDADHAAADAQHAECRDRAMEQLKATNDALDAVVVNNAAEAQAVRDARAAAADLWVQQNADCDETRKNQREASWDQYWAQLESLRQEASDGLA